MNTKPTEEVPAYEELYEQTPQNKRTGYSHIPTDPDADLENQAPGLTHTHEVEFGLPALGSSSTGLQLQQSPREHFHCETCDLQRERREKRDSEHRHCQTVSRTFMFFGLMLTLILIITLPTVAAIVNRRRRY
ncbi:unnamed protein product [Penicillium manginii]